MKRAFPTIIFRLGIPATVCVWLLASRLLWEQTVWTWERGPQMVGFSLMHSGLGALLILAAVVSLVWPILVVVAAVRSRNMGKRGLWALVVAYAMAWLILVAPYGFWQRLFIGRFPRSQAIELMINSAASGDMKTVSAFLESGVPINAQGRNGTALHAAAVQGELETMEFLLARGAEVNAINAFGNSPMENARQAWKRPDESQALLAMHGGKVTRGSEDQMNRVIQQQVHEDMQHMENAAPK